MENNELEFIIKRGITDNTPRKLVFNPEFIKFESNDLSSNLYTTLNKNEITEFRYGMKWITFNVTFGRQYFIYIRNRENKIIKINFRTYFGRKKSEYQKLYSDIVQNLRIRYFEEKVEELIKKYENNEDFIVGEVHFYKENIGIKLNGIINVTEKLIPWEKIRTKNYISYLAVYNVDEPSTINRGYSYLKDWNTSVLYSVLRTILRNKGIEKYD
jgi:hypothetical protein